MFRYPYQIHECPVCGRPLEVRDEHRGRRITCPHCHGQFVARKPIDTVKTGAASKETLLGRADQLLQMSARRLFVAGRTATHPVR